jgi:hypothetical protein
MFNFMLKKIIQTALLLVVLCTTATTYAQVSQAPDGIQFQALATDANGHPAAGRVIYVKDAIVAKTATGTIVYSETFKVTASSAGIFTIVLGKGTYAGGVTSIANIDWANGPFFLNLKIAVEPTIPNASWNVNNEYVDLGTSQFWSVPYAMYAGNVKGADTKLNIADTAAMLKPYFTSVNLKANIESPTFTGTVSGITKAMVGLGNVDNTADINKPVSTAAQAALDLKVDKVMGKALSTNDYTTAEKTKLAAISGTNTGDQDLSALAVAVDVNAALDTKVSSAAATAALALKANAADVDAALALKANDANVASSLALKSNTIDVNNSLALKVDKVTGKALSTNDYTTAEKTKLAAILGTNTGDQINITGNAATASKLLAPKNINGVPFDGSADITIASSASLITGVVPISNGGTSQTTLPGIKSMLGLLSNNVAIGNEAGTPNQGGNANTIAIGGGAGRGNQGASSIAIGYVSGDQNQGANSISIGGNAAQSGQGTQAVAIGFAAGQSGQGANAVAIGTFAGQSGQAANSIAINATGTSTPLNPTNAGFYVDPIRSATATTGLLFYNPTSKEITTATANASFVDLTTNQTIAGIKTFNSNISANGVSLGRGNGNNDESVAIGSGAMGSSNINGKRNTAVGSGAMRLYNGTSWDNNTSIGYYNLPNMTSGSGNTSVGAESMMANIIGTENTSVGNQSLINSTGNNNVGIGKRSGQTITSGSQNTIIGTDADVSTATLTNATALGYGAIVTASNTVQLGSTSVTNVKTSGTLTADAVTYPKVHGTAGQVLSTTGSGTLAWTTIPAGPIFKQSRVNQNSATGTVDSEIEVGGMAFRYNKQSQKIEVKRITNLESEWQAYITSRIESGVSQALQQPYIISTGGTWAQLSGTLNISGYYHSFEFEMTPYLRGQASDNHSFNIKVLLDGWGVVTLRVIYY